MPATVAARPDQADVVARTLEQLERFAQVLWPSEVDEPILAQSTASAAPMRPIAWPKWSNASRPTT